MLLALITIRRRLERQWEQRTAATEFAVFCGMVAIALVVTWFTTGRALFAALH